jgi:ribosomal protein L11 methyltransferase
MYFNFTILSRSVTVIWATKLHHSSKAFLGVVEGRALVETRILDTAEAPLNRDLVNDLHQSAVLFYFQDELTAQHYQSLMQAELPIHIKARTEREAPQDWNANWKLQFQGVNLSPDWQILPAWKKSEPKMLSNLTPLYINPGMGFGSGEHATTALCLQALGKKGSLYGKRVLDFGSGSGILAIAAALRGALVDAVEIDAEARENALDCFRLNGVENRTRLVRELRLLGQPLEYDLIIANILSPVLMEFATELVKRLGDRSEIILSGLLREQVEEILEVYKPLLKDISPNLAVAIEYQGDWAAVRFQLSRPKTHFKSHRSIDEFDRTSLRWPEWIP